MKVTNIIGWDKKGNAKESFYMDGWLKTNLDGVPRFLKADYDCVGVISGHGKVRQGKSSLAAQIGAYISWLIAGGKIRTHQIEEGEHVKWIIDYVVNPKRKINFNLYENVCWTADELQKRAEQLYKKYGKGQVLIYDEGRQGLDSARAMESINKGMQDFFQTCGMYGHVILIVLPNYFKLHEDYAVARSLFLIDVFADKHYRRGYFNFFNEEQKEKLFFFGKKRIGIRAKYSAATPSFGGRFTSWFPFEKKEYDRLKSEAISKIKRARVFIKYKKQRDAAFWMLKKHAELKSPAIAEEVSAISQIKIQERAVRQAISNITGQNYEEVE